MATPSESIAFRFSRYCPGVVADCVWILIIVVVGAFPEIVTGGMDEQLGASGMDPPAGTVTSTHSRVTLPVKPFAGVTVTVEIPLSPTATITGVPLSEKLGGTTVRDASAEVLPA
jgi:hypothetical protein